MSYDPHQRLLDSVTKIKNGDLQARNDLLDEYRPFIWKASSQLCKRPLTWGNDDELSEALIGFNDALDSFDPAKEVPFLPYARVIMNNRIKDFFRRQGKLSRELPFKRDTEDKEVFNSGEQKAAWETYQNKTIEEERQEELELYENFLKQYGIGFEDLVAASPKHKDSRQTLLTVAKTLTNNKDLMEYLISKKQLPLNTLTKISGVNRKTLERGRKFIIASALALYHKEEFIYLRSYINFD